jgi:RNA polymerase sigma-70 factor (ECF subfamily)
MEEVKKSEYASLYQRYARRLYGFFLRQLNHDTQAAADATHEVFLRVMEAPSSWERANGEVAPYLFTIAYNLLRNRYRRQAYETDYLATLDRQPLETTDVELRLDRQTLLTALRQVLDELPPPLRLLFSLRYEEELTVPQVAQILAIPEGTVKSRLHKTITIIRKKLKQYEG